MRTILVLNSKGGSGKTTIATNLAGYYADRGTSVALADFDPQGSSIDWLAARGADRPAIRSVEAFHAGARLPTGVDVTIMDAPARTHGEDLSGLVRRAQTIVIPIVPSPLDLRAAERFLDELFRIKAVEKGEVKVATIANRAREGSLAASELGEYLEGLKLPSGKKLPFLALIRASVNYLRAAERGLSIFEFAPMATAVDREHWAPLTRWLNGSRSLPD